MLKLGSREELAHFLKVFEDYGVCLLYENSSIGSVLGELTLAVHELNEGKAVLLTYLGVVLTEGGSNVNYTCTVGHGYVVITDDIVSLSLLTGHLVCGEVE